MLFSTSFSIRFIVTSLVLSFILSSLSPRIAVSNATLQTTITDEFVDNRLDWEISTNASTYSNIEGGKYVMDITASPQSRYWVVTPGFTNWSLAPFFDAPYQYQFEVSNVSSSDGAISVAVVFDALEGYSVYKRFYIGHDGTWQLIKWIDASEERIVLAEGSLAYPVNLQDGQTHVIGLTVEQDYYSLAVDGQVVVTTSSVEPIFGTIGFGLAEGTRANKQLHGEFDNVVISPSAPVDKETDIVGRWASFDPSNPAYPVGFVDYAFYPDGFVSISGGLCAADGTYRFVSETTLEFNIIQYCEHGTGENVVYTSEVTIAGGVLTEIADTETLYFQKSAAINPIGLPTEFPAIEHRGFGRLLVYPEPSFDGEFIGGIDEGTAYEVTQKTSDGEWLQIDFNGTLGWVQRGISLRDNGLILIVPTYNNSGTDDSLIAIETFPVMLSSPFRVCRNDDSGTDAGIERSAYDVFVNGFSNSGSSCTTNIGSVMHRMAIFGGAEMGKNDPPLEGYGLGQIEIAIIPPATGTLRVTAIIEVNGSLSLISGSIAALPDIVDVISFLPNVLVSDDSIQSIFEFMDMVELGNEYSDWTQSNAEVTAYLYVNNSQTYQITEKVGGRSLSTKFPIHIADSVDFVSEEVTLTLELPVVMGEKIKIVVGTRIRGAAHGWSSVFWNLRGEQTYIKTILIENIIN